MLKLTRSNPLHEATDKLLNNAIKYNATFEKTHASNLESMIVESSIVEYVEQALNDATAWTGDKLAVKREREDFTRRAKRAVAFYYAVVVDGTTEYCKALDTKYDRKGKIYNPVIRVLSETETVSKNGDIIKRKVETDDDATDDDATDDDVQTVANLEATVAKQKKEMSTLQGEASASNTEVQALRDELKTVIKQRDEALAKASARDNDATATERELRDLARKIRLSPKKMPRSKLVEQVASW